MVLVGRASSRRLFVALRTELGGLPSIPRAAAHHYLAAGAIAALRCGARRLPLLWKMVVLDLPGAP